MIGPKFKVEIREINKPNTPCVKKITLSLKKNKDHIHEREWQGAAIPIKDGYKKYL